MTRELQYDLIILNGESLDAAVTFQVLSFGQSINDFGFDDVPGVLRRTSKIKFDRFGERKIEEEALRVEQ
jgi:hypothetical protein